MFFGSLGTNRAGELDRRGTIVPTRPACQRRLDIPYTPGRRTTQMPTYKKGDRVIATDDLAGALLPTVPKGTEGVVTHVGWFGLTVSRPS